MGYDIGWAIVGSEPLVAEELARLHAHVQAWAPRIMEYDLRVSIAAQPEVQAWFSLRPSRNPDVEVDEDFYGDGAFGFAMDVVEEIFEALAEMRAMVPRHEVVVQDDFHGFRWTGTGFDIVNDVSIDHPAWDDVGWIALGTLSLEQVKERFADGEAAAAAAPPVEQVPGSTASVVRGKQKGPVDELIEMAIDERARVTPVERQKYHLDLPDSPSRYDIRDAIAKSLSVFFTEEAADLLLENAEQWMSSLTLQDVAPKVFERAAQTPERIARVKALWARTVEESNRSRDLNSYLRPYAPVLFDAAVEILRAPLPSLDWDACATAIDIASRANSRRGDAVAVLTACIRRDRRHPRWERVRDTAIAALERLGDPRSAATGLVEMSQSERPSSDCIRLIARDPERGLAMLERMRDCAGFAEYATQLVEGAPDAGAVEATALALLQHPFWRIRIYALGLLPYSTRLAVAAAVWATFAGADTGVTDEERERFLDKRLGNLDREGWLVEARKHGVTQLLAPLPTAVEGLTSWCSDHRTWALEYVATRQRIEDAAALIMADELDLALAHRGHARTLIKWTRWRDAIGDMPVDAAGRGAWARERLQGVSAELQAIAERGAAEVAVGYPSGRFTLSSNELTVLDRREQDIALRGEQLLGLAVVPAVQAD